MKLNPKLKPGTSRKNLLFASLTLFMLFTSLFACVHVSNVKGQTEKLAKPNTTTTATVVGRGVVNTQKPQTPNVTLTPNATLISKNEQTQNSNTKNRYTLIGLIFALVITFLIVFFMDHPKE